MAESVFSVVTISMPVPQLNVAARGRREFYSTRLAAISFIIMGGVSNDEANSPVT